jgi:hypothetical protein
MGSRLADVCPGCTTGNTPLFKYVTPDRIDVIRHLRIRFSPPSEFNDPFELLPDMRVIESPEWLDQLKSALVPQAKVEHPDLADPEIERLVLDRYAQRLGDQKKIALEVARKTADFNRILSLSRVPPDDPDALLLWACYTTNHSGFVIEFDEAHPWVQYHKFKPGEAHDLKDVVYRPRRAGWNGLFPAGDFLFTKSAHWNYEKEVRLIRMVGDREFDRIPVDSLLFFPPDVLRSVTLGVNCTSANAVRAALNGNSKLQHVVLQQAELHPDEFALTLTKLSR